MSRAYFNTVTVSSPWLHGEIIHPYCVGLNDKVELTLVCTGLYQYSGSISLGYWAKFQDQILEQKTVLFIIAHSYILYIIAHTL